MYRYKLKLTAVLLLTVLSACTVQNGRPGFARQTMAYQDSVTGLMRFYEEVAEMRGSRYLSELKRAREAFQRSPDKDSRLRLVSVLMNASSPDAGSHYREAETVLNDYIQAKKYAFFDEDYSALASMLLTINQDWQRLNRQLVSAKIESADARKKLEELKSIEMRLNRPGNGYH